MQRWLFETPWWLLSAIAVAAVAVLVSANNRQNARLKAAGLAVLGLGAALWAVSFFVETPREICVRQTRQWVNAVVARDQAALAALLHPKASFARNNKEQIIEKARHYADLYGLQGAIITQLQAQPDPVMVTVNLSVLTRHDAKAAFLDTIPSAWELNWVRSNAGGWVLKDIIGIRIGQADRDRIQDFIR
jgi:uncharacterized membrane protein YkgB